MPTHLSGTERLIDVNEALLRNEYAAVVLRVFLGIMRETLLARPATSWILRAKKINTVFRLRRKRLKIKMVHLHEDGRQRVDTLSIYTPLDGGV